jgi:hypothetical protein
MKWSLGDLATVLAKVVPPAELGPVIVCLLNCSEDDQLTEDEGDLGEIFFECLCEASPEAMKVAQGGWGISYP